VEATVIAEPRVVLALMSGAMAPRAAVRDGAVRVQGDAAALEDFPALFDMGGRVLS
jgi:hypothetical protein